MSKTTKIPIVDGVLIFPEDRIRQLPTDNLIRYKKLVSRKRNCLKGALEEYCTCCLSRVLLRTHESTPELVVQIRAFDYAVHASQRELDRREALSGEPKRSKKVKVDVRTANKSNKFRSRGRQRQVKQTTVATSRTIPWRTYGAAS